MATPDQELVQEIENKAGFTGDAYSAAKVISDASLALIEDIGKTDIHSSVKITPL